MVQKKILCLAHIVSFIANNIKIYYVDTSIYYLRIMVVVGRVSYFMIHEFHLD